MSAGGRPQPTAKLVAANFQKLLSKMSGVDVTGPRDEQVSQYCQIRSERYKRTITGGLDGFIKGNDYSFLIDCLACTSSRKRRKIIKQVLQLSCFLHVHTCDSTRPLCAQ